MGLPDCSLEQGLTIISVALGPTAFSFFRLRLSTRGGEALDEHHIERLGGTEEGDRCRRARLDHYVRAWPPQRCASYTIR